MAALDRWWPPASWPAARATLTERAHTAALRTARRAGAGHGGFALQRSRSSRGLRRRPAARHAPPWLTATTSIAGAAIPNSRLVVIAIAIAVLALLLFFCNARVRTDRARRGGNRAMVSAPGSMSVVRLPWCSRSADGSRTRGVLAATYYGTIDPSRGTAMLIFAFIVVVIGGLGSIAGSAVAALVVGLMQQFLNFYAAAGIGDFAVILLLAGVLLIRPGGLSGSAT